METLLDIKNTYAQEKGYEDWDELATITCYTDGYQMEAYMDEICIRAQKEALEKAAENAHGNYEDKEVGYYWASAEGITNEENLIR